jgi:hypothetical protein
MGISRMDQGGAMIFRLYYKTKGDHVHCRLFAEFAVAGYEDGQLGWCGDLTMTVAEFDDFRNATPFIQYLEKKAVKTLVALVGTKHRGSDAIALLASLPQGEPLTLIRDRDNQHDPHAVQVWARDRCVGFIKATQVRPIAARLDSMIETSAKLAFDGGNWPMVEIEESRTSTGESDG